jgi:hypothetical protein
VTVTHEWLAVAGESNLFQRMTRRRLATVVTAATVGLCGSVAIGKAQEESPKNALLVRGDANLDGGEMAWRVVQDVAERSDGASFQRRALGFTVNSGIFTDLLLTDEATGSAYRLAPDEAAFVGEGTMQRRESLGNAAEQYLRIALVKAELATDAGGDRMVYAGRAFDAPAGPITLTLERLDLQAGDRTHAGTGMGHTLILVLQGEIEIEEGEAGPRTHLQTVVGSGISYAAHSTPWGTSITSLRNGTSVLLSSMQ